MPADSKPVRLTPLVEIPPSSPSPGNAHYDLMSAERPLDALLPQLRKDAVPIRPIHPRVLEVGDSPEEAEWVLIWWADPTGERQLFEQSRKLVEASLLSELSLPASVRRHRTLRYTSMRLAQLVEFSGDAGRCLRPFGFSPDPEARRRNLGCMNFIEREARDAGVAIPPFPVEMWKSTIRHPEGELGRKLLQLEGMLAERLGGDVWGNTPGGPSRMAARLVEEVFHTRIEATLDGLRTFEMLLVSHEVGVIRWIPPLLFQALCDFVGVIGESVFGRRVAWAVSELDGDFAPPPLLRLDLPSGRHAHLAVGLHVLRWCVMPLQPGEEVSSLAEWAAHEFNVAEA